MGTIRKLLQKLVILCVKCYQVLISVILPARCRFWPTCSEYCIEAIERYGLLKGSFLSIKRLLKCQPLHPGGYDPLTFDDPKQDQTQCKNK